MAFFSFDKKSRILKREDFLRIGKQGRPLRTKHFTILCLKNNIGNIRCGITVSKRIGNAVKRNRVKRFLREFFRLNRDHLKESSDYIFIARNGSSKLEYCEIENELLSVFTKKVLNKTTKL